MISRFTICTFATLAVSWEHAVCAVFRWNIAGIFLNIFVPKIKPYPQVCHFPIRAVNTYKH